MFMCKPKIRNRKLSRYIPFENSKSKIGFTN
nr:MAG TPA: hypothetical protein [Caudoviricetes sp.]